MTAFADDFDVVALDMRGYNVSDKPQVRVRNTIPHTALQNTTQPSADRTPARCGCCFQVSAKEEKLVGACLH
jgi:pimeloyl-ACP methyl ester carboxylesterase